jgi:hypothetical protein
VKTLVENAPGKCCCIGNACWATIVAMPPMIYGCRTARATKHNF